MKRLLSFVLMGIVAVGFSLGGIISYVTYENPMTTAATYTKYLTFKDDYYDRDVKVEIYTRSYGETDHNPTFAIGDLVNKEINYRMKHEEATDMTLDVVFYRLEPETAYYYELGSRNYGKLTSLKEDYVDGCERIAYSFIRAAKWGIKTHIIWDRPETTQDKNYKKVQDYFDAHLDEPCIFDPTKKVSDFMVAKESAWGDGLKTNMHSKIVCVSNYLDNDGTEYEDAVYISTGNLDSYRSSNLPISYKDWAQTGNVVSGHPYVYQAHKKYIDIIFENNENKMEFENAVFEAHNKGDIRDGGLNYADENFECYFTPQSMEGSPSFYDMQNNPVARCIERLNDCDGRIECFVNMYYTSDTIIINQYFDRILEAFRNNKNKGNKFGIVENSYLKDAPELCEKLNEIGDVTVGKMTHEKNSYFYFGDTDEYVVITGVTNWSVFDLLVSNTMFVFKERGEHHEIYDCFYDNYVKTKDARR